MKRYKIGKVLIGRHSEPINAMMVEATSQQQAISLWQMCNTPLNHLWTLSVKELSCKDTD